MNLVEALTLARDAGAKVRPVSWRDTGNTNWVACEKYLNGDGLFLRMLRPSAANYFDLHTEAELLGEWEVLP